LFASTAGAPLFAGGACSQAQSPGLAAPHASSTTRLQTSSSPLDNILIEETDEDDVPTDVFSSVSFEYDHGSFSGAVRNDRYRIKGEQAFGPNHRLAIGYELPFIDGYGVDLGDGTPEPSGQGLGDVKVSLSGVLGETARFKHAAKVEFTFPSAPNNVVGSGQTVIRMEWGLSTPLQSKTTLDGTLAYNKALTTNNGPGENSFEPEIVLAHEFANRLAGYLDYDTYEDFNAEAFGQTLKAGLTFALDEQKRWGLSPYAQFPLNHFTSSTNLKSDAGVELSFRH
jgi:hypothetical protein